MKLYQLLCKHIMFPQFFLCTQSTLLNNVKCSKSPERGTRAPNQTFTPKPIKYSSALPAEPIQIPLKCSPERLQFLAATTVYRLRHF